MAGGKITHQPNEDAEELYDVCVCDAVQAPEQRVEHGDARAEDDRRPVIHVDDHTQRSSCMETKLNNVLKFEKHVITEHFLLKVSFRI